MAIERVFSDIYAKRKWGKHVPSSGEGSSQSAVFPYLEFLSEVLSQYDDIKVILDIGHGDWEMWPTGFFNSYKYVGVDVVSELSSKLNLIYGNSNTQFIGGDFLEMPLPQADLLLIKDVLIHLSDSEIKKAIKLFKSYKYIITVTDIESSGLRVFLGCLYKSIIAPDKIAFFRLLKNPSKLIETFLTSDISTGDYHWVRLHDLVWVNMTNKLKVLKTLQFGVSGLTPGRKVVKEITLFTNLVGEIK